MKYKKLLLLITSLIFFTALFCSFFAVFKTAEIFVCCKQIENSPEDLSNSTKVLLEKYHNKNLVFINKDKLKNEIESLSGYIKVDDIDKKFPNKLNVYISERKEEYAIKLLNGYLIVDSEYKVLKVNDKNCNNVDNLPLIEFNVNVADYDETIIKQGTRFTLYDTATNNVLSTLSTYLKNRRQNVKSITINVRSDGKLNRFLTFEMAEGVIIQIDKVDENTVEKLEKLFNYYDTLENKGDIVKKYVTKLESGDIVVLG